ncbi:MAG: PEP-CTERM sorting domain-containing protein [Pseudomonadales bacterium]
MDGDGNVNGTDLLAWESQYGSIKPVSASSNIPEPSTFVLLIAGLLGRLAGKRVDDMHRRFLTPTRSRD